jgi:hypothetical protein
MISEGDLNYWRGMASFFSIAEDSSEDAIRKRYQHWKAEQSSERNPRLAWAALGLALYGDPSAIPDVLRNAPPPPTEHEGTMQKFLIQILVSILPLPENLQSDYEIRKNPKPLMDWYEKHKELLVWDSEKNAYRLNADG